MLHVKPLDSIFNALLFLSYTGYIEAVYTYKCGMYGDWSSMCMYEDGK